MLGGKPSQKSRKSTIFLQIFPFCVICNPITPFIAVNESVMRIFAEALPE